MQVCCYEDSKLLKLFTDIVRMLYDCDILAEDTINWWAKKVRPGPLSASQSMLYENLSPRWHSETLTEWLLAASCPACYCITHLRAHALIDLPFPATCFSVGPTIHRRVGSES